MATLMIDLLYVLLALLFFLACWSFTKACDRLWPQRRTPWITSLAA